MFDLKSFSDKCLQRKRIRSCFLSGVPASGEQTLDWLTNNTCQQIGGVMDLRVFGYEVSWIYASAKWICGVSSIRRARSELSVAAWWLRVHLREICWQIGIC